MGSKIKLALIAFFTFFSVNAFSQACGEGTFEFRFYIPQGMNIGQMNYSVLKLENEEQVDYFRFAYIDRQLDLNRGSVIDNNIVNKFLAENPDLDEYYIYKNPDPDGFPYLKGTQPSSERVIRDGKLKFMTLETGYTPCILRVSYGEKYFYIVANLYGGCNKTTEVIVREDGTAVIAIPKDY